MGARQTYSHIDKRVIFRETFNSDADVRKNGGVPTGVTFDNGKGAFNGSSYINTNKIFSNIIKNGYSIRVIFKTTDLSGIENQIILGERDGNIGFSVGISNNYNSLYVAHWGVYALESETNILVENTWYEAIYVFISGTGFVFYLNNLGYSVSNPKSMILSTIPSYIGTHNTQSGPSSVNYFDGEIDLIEVYNTVLTAEEVLLLYQKRLYDKPVLSQTQQLGSELHTNANAASITDEADAITGFTGVRLDEGANIFESQTEITNGSSYAIYVDINDSPGQYNRFYTDLNAAPFNCVIGTRYRMQADVRHIGTGGKWALLTSGESAGNSGTTILISDVLTAQTTFTTINHEWTYTANTRYFIVRENDTLHDGGVYFDNFSVKEITKEQLTPILDINPLKGTLEDKYGNSITNTDVTMFQQNGKWVGKYNGDTSKLNSSNIIIDTGDISILVWFKLHSWGESAGRGQIISNKKFTIFVDTDADRLRVTSNNLTYAGTVSNALLLGKWVCIGITRTLTGLATFYIDGILNSTPNQNSGTPTVGITDFTIGNSDAQTAAFDGLIGEVQIIQGILSPQEIQNYYQSTKNNYIG